MRHLCCVLLVFLGFTPSIKVWADSKSKPQDTWLQYFSGQPHPGLMVRVDDLNHNWPIRQWIKGYQQCRSQVDSLWLDLETYQELFFSGQYSEADELYKKINAQQSTSGDCSQPLWTALLVKAVLLGPMPNHQRPTNDDQEPMSPRASLSFLERSPSPRSDSASVRQKPLSERFTDYRYELSLLVAFLGNRGTLQKLNPHLRHVFAGDYPESLWLQKNEEGYFTVAFYDCYESLIYLDTELRPFNLAASLYHELDHLYRDKKISTLILPRNSSIEDASIADDIEKYLATDELLATISSGFYQRRMLEVDRNVRLDGLSIGNEFNFFQIDGPLNESFELLFSDSSQPIDKVPNPSNFLANLSNYGSLYGGHRAETILCEMQDIILDGYFSEGQIKSCQSSDDLLGDFREMGNTLLDYEFRSFANGRAVVEESYIPRVGESDEETSLTTVIEYFDGWTAALSRPSYGCEKIIEAQNDGEIQGYLGTQLAGSLGGRTGNGGIRPWLMPMTTTTEQGERTLRPSNHGIRPCFRRKF